MERAIKNLVIFFVLIAGCITSNAQPLDEFSNFAPTVYPDRIMLTIPGDPAATRAVSWRTVFENTASIAEIAMADAGPQQLRENHPVTGTHAAWETGSQTAMGHKVIFEGLKPNTKYAYRVGDGDHWSEWFQFETSSGEPEPFSFLYFGDVQNDIKSDCSRILREAYTHFPKAAFMLFAGDLVSKSQEEYWREFFYTVSGNLYDEFQIVKNKKGGNRFIESKKIATIEQRTEIPEGAREKYTKEELQKYKEKFQKNKK
jgi:phosphodiesterase/alkaline phosphatase D-like protein